MASKQTQEKILETALGLFNKDGLVNVRLQHICDASIISLGNITYHFKTKDEIIFALWEQIEAEQKVLMAEFKTLPLFEDVDRYILAQFHLQQKYLFFYTDTLEIVRAFSRISEAHRNHILWQEQQLAWMFKFNEARGALVKNDDEDFYSKLSSLWLWVSENWIHRQLILLGDIRSYENFHFTLWQLIKPTMTDQGKNEFDQLTQLKHLIGNEQ